MARNYINNRELHAVMEAYYAEANPRILARHEELRIEGIPEKLLNRNIRKTKWKHGVPVPKYVAEAIMQMSTKIATKINFSGYTYKDEMILDGIENCLIYIDNYNPEKSDNPFAYFSLIIWRSFIRRIKKEKKQADLKNNIVLNANILDSLVSRQIGDTNVYENGYLDFLQNVIVERVK